MDETNRPGLSVGSIGEFSLFFRVKRGHADDLRAAPTASMLIYAAVPVLYFIAITFARSAASPGSAEGDLT